MSNGAWTDETDEENNLIVAAYFAMLADDISGRHYSKAEHRRALLPLLNDRFEGSVEFKHQNISAVLKGLGGDWIPGDMIGVGGGWRRRGLRHRELRARRAAAPD